jgi:uncharacterized RmlC-like cupin family protein
MHHHGVDYVAVALGATDVNSITPDGNVKHVVLQDGDVRYTPAGVTHVVTNLATTPFHNATIELKQNNGHPVCVNNCANDPRSKDWPALPPESRLIGYGDNFRIVELIVAPKQTVAIRVGGPLLVVMVSDLHAQITGENKPPVEVSHQAGDIIFHETTPPHQATNLSEQPLRMVGVEFKPSKE